MRKRETAAVSARDSSTAQELIERALPLRGLPDAVNITDGAGARAHLDVLSAAVLLARTGLEPVLQLTCRDRNRIALQSLLIGAAALGLRNVLALRGDEAAVRIALPRCQLPELALHIEVAAGAPFDVVHCHDWPTALVATYVRELVKDDELLSLR